MKKKNYDEAKVIRILSKKRDIRIDSVRMTIEIVKNSTEVGNGSWGKIDYLRKIHGYVVIFVAAIKRASIVPKDDEQEIVTRHSKRDRFSMAAMSKAAMKRVKVK